MMVRLPHSFFFYFGIACFTSYFVYMMYIAVLLPTLFFQIGIWDLRVFFLLQRRQSFYVAISVEKLWTTPGIRLMKHASSMSENEPGHRIKLGTFGIAD